MGEAEIIRLHDRRTAPAPEAERKRCAATTATGRPCRNFALPDDAYCSIHSRAGASARRRHPARGDDGAGRPPEPVPGRSLFDGIGDFVRRRLDGGYPIDDFGYDQELHREVLLPLQRPLYERYFRVRTLGVDRIPESGAALLVGNHSGTIPVDAVMVQHAVATEHPRHRTVRNVAADLAFHMPFVGPLARKTGNAVACDEDAHELLRRGELVGVYPEGYKGVGKGWKERYKLQRFGRGGFIEVALRMRTPIVPVAIVGAEEAFPMIANAKLLARTFGFPYFPVTPTFPLLGPLGLLPLPSRWLIEFGDPIPMDDYPEDAAEDAMLVFDLADRIRDTIQQMLYRNLSLRGRPFF
ncbi:MAG TPA: lysophospholipid acyltransferase family protein [Actinomycetota bacterium]|nr:lysophospholipid acyltransferase family protein [Actinomycetota bacterium]